MTERRSYLIVWHDKHVALRPEVFGKDEEDAEVADFKLAKGEVLNLSLPAALAKPAGQWIFWPSGTCEPATVQFGGNAGSWTADYSPLTVRPELKIYAPR